MKPLSQPRPAAVGRPALNQKDLKTALAYDPAIAGMCRSKCADGDGAAAGVPPAGLGDNPVKPAGPAVKTCHPQPPTHA